MPQNSVRLTFEVSGKRLKFLVCDFIFHACNKSGFESKTAGSSTIPKLCKISMN